MIHQRVFFFLIFETEISLSSPDKKNRLVGWVLGENGNLPSE